MLASEPSCCVHRHRQCSSSLSSPLQDLTAWGGHSTGSSKDLYKYKVDGGGIKVKNIYTLKPLYFTASTSKKYRSCHVHQTCAMIGGINLIQNGKPYCNNHSVITLFYQMKAKTMCKTSPFIIINLQNYILLLYKYTKYLRIFINSSKQTRICIKKQIP